ncbi:MAG: type I DNA topoisomerase [Neisseriaceae bacterium]
MAKNPKNLLIVESPSKAKTLKKYLGAQFEILASYGHVRDLVPKRGAVDPEKDFAMEYELIAKNKKHVDAIIKAALSSDQIYLATDPDREGEAISWHIQEILKKNKKLKEVQLQRVIFNEITRSAVTSALEHPRSLSQALVDAQQTRRALDYLVGFNLSPLLWKKIHPGLSAGRAQSPALRLICEREEEIKKFQSQEYWTIHLDSHKEERKFSAKLWRYQQKKLGTMDIGSEEEQKAIVETLRDRPAIVSKVEKKHKKRRPVAPFSTSTLQQEASRKLLLSTAKTMRLAQQLYEGIDLEQQTVGLITYMRTDSVRLSAEALIDIRNYVEEELGADYLPASARVYKTKTKNAQEAHEAIRPTSMKRTPESIKGFLDKEQYALYELIWKRTLASQMAEASLQITSVDIEVGEGVFRASGQVIIFKGFLAIYEEGSDQETPETGLLLPKLTEKEELPVDRLHGQQHFTLPPPRYTEAALVKSLEEYGIGRPSTYASIISTLKERKYVISEKKHFRPTDTGEIVNQFLTQHFQQYVDYHFTARMEDDLDRIANGKRAWLPIMRSFWKDFSQQVKAKEGISRKEVTTQDIEEVCPQCQKHQLQIKYGRWGRFIACPDYPECSYTRPMDQAQGEGDQELNVLDGKLCPQCGGQLVYKRGRYGKFIGCANYPQCKHIEPLKKPRDTGVACPKCKKGTLLEKKSHRGKPFFGCSAYPTCDYAIWNTPLNESCPKCGWPILTVKTTKRKGSEKVCPQKSCDFSEPITGLVHLTDD